MVHAEITVAAVVERNAHFLVVEEIARGRRVINQPAGHVEPGETIVDAVVRETREETGWAFIPSGLVGMYYYPHHDGRTTLRFAFCGDVCDYAADQPLDQGIVAAHWLAPNDLAARDNLRSPLVTKAIDDFSNRDPLSLDRVEHVHG